MTSKNGEIERFKKAYDATQPMVDGKYPTLEFERYMQDGVAFWHLLREIIARLEEEEKR